MRILGVTETCDLGDLYVSLRREGHQVRVHVSDPDAQGTLDGLIDKTCDWRAELEWIRAAPDLGVIIFESVSEGFGALHDSLRADGFKVIGGSAYGDRLENDRPFAQAVLTELGFPAGHAWRFEDACDAALFIASRPGRYVLKWCGSDHNSSDTYVGQQDDGSDVIAMQQARADKAGPLMLQSFIEGVEVGVGAYFNGQRFLTPACLDWEHKRFFPGDMGELTGEMGTVVTYERSERLFELALLPMESRLRAAGHVGWVNLNTIINEAGIWPLEFSCRFGYPGYAILSPLQANGWGELIRTVADPASFSHETDPGFCTGVVLTTPPFPYTRRQVNEPIGLPVMIGPKAHPRHVHFGEVGCNDAGQLVTSGLYGWTLVVTGAGDTIEQSVRAAYKNAAAVSVPNLRYRLDIGERLMAGEFQFLEALGLLDGPVALDKIA